MHFSVTAFLTVLGHIQLPSADEWQVTSLLPDQTKRKRKNFGQFRMGNFVSEDRSEIIFWTYPAHIHTSYPLKTWGHVIQFTDQRLCLNWNYGICHNWNSQMHSQPIWAGVKGRALWRTFDKTTPLFSGKCSGNHWHTAVCTWTRPIWKMHVMFYI